MADKIPATGQIADDLYILNLRIVCAYLVKSGKSFIMFDAGMNPGRVLAELRKLSIEPTSISSIVLTHSDRDHVGGLSAFPSAKVFLPAAEIVMIDHTKARFFGFVFNKLATESYESLVDGQDLRIGPTTIRCIASPGHTAGHMSYLVNGSILILGDVLNLSGGRIVMDRGFMNLDNNQRRDSIKRLAALSGISYLCPMHSGFSGDFEAAAKEWK